MTAGLMRAVRLARTGGPEVLSLEEVPTPAPGPADILVRHHAIGLNFIDVYHRAGLYPIPLPATLGLEAAGVVEAVGAEVGRFHVGDRVGYCGTLGAYAEAGVVPADRAVGLPDSVSFEVAAGSLLKGLTAEFLARRMLPLQAGDFALVHAAAGGVGSLLTQWLSALGVRVIGTAGSPEKALAARCHGAEAVILYDAEDVAERVRAVTDGRGVRIAYDSVGRATFQATLASLGRRGLLVSYGNASGPVPAIEPLRLARGGSLSLTRPTLFDYIATTDELDEAAAALFDVIASGAVKVEIGRRFPLAEVQAAHRTLEARETTGSTVLFPGMASDELRV